MAAARCLLLLLACAAALLPPARAEKPSAYISVVTASDVDSHAYVGVFAQRALLAAMGSTAPHVVVAVGLTGARAAARGALQQAGFDVRDFEDVTALHPAQRLDDTHNAIAAWRQTDIGKGILLDKHVLVRSNLDDLFHHPPFTAAYDYPALEMNTAVLVMQPDLALADTLFRALGRPHTNTGDGTFQGFLNAVVQERHFLMPFTVGDMRYSLLGNSWGEEQVFRGRTTRYKPSITRTFAFVDKRGLPLRTPWTAQPFGSYDPDVLAELKHEYASAVAEAAARWPAFRAHLYERGPRDLLQHLQRALPFRPIDHRARSLPGCLPERPDGFEYPVTSSSGLQQRSDRPPRYAYASVMVGVRDINGLLLQHQLLEWTNTTLPHIVLAVGLPSRELDRLRRAGMEPVVLRRTPYADHHAGFHKLFLFNMTEYTKLVFLDADAWPLKNIDFLFSYPGLAGAPDNFIVNEFNSGVMVIEPHEGLFWHLQRMYEMYVIGHIGLGTDGTDQGFLNTVCATWIPLPFTVNYRFFTNFTDPAFHATRELFYLTHRFDAIAVVHAYTFVKPHLLPSWELTDQSRADQPPDLRLEFPSIFDPILRRLWHAWVTSRDRWGHRPPASQNGPPPAGG